MKAWAAIQNTAWKCFLCCVALAAATSALSRNSLQQDVPAVVEIEVDASKPVHDVPRTIFGSFLEPIGNSIYGGLWAEILQNPSFEDNLWNAEAVKEMISSRPELARSSQLGLPLPWEPLDPVQGNRYEPRWNDAANSYRSVLIMGLSASQV